MPLCNITCKAQSIENEKHFYLTKENPPDQCQHISKRGTCWERLLFSKDWKDNVLFTYFFYHNFDCYHQINHHMQCSVDCEICDYYSKPVTRLSPYKTHLFYKYTIYMYIFRLLAFKSKKKNKGKFCIIIFLNNLNRVLVAHYVYKNEMWYKSTERVTTTLYLL